MPDFKSLAVLISGFFTIFAWLLYGNKKEELKRLEKETAEKDLINKDLAENAEIKRTLDNIPFKQLSDGLLKRAKDKANK